TTHLPRQFQFTIEQHPEGIRELTLAEENLPHWECHFRAQSREGMKLLVGELLEQEGGSEIVNKHHSLSRYLCTRCTAIAPSPTAEATRFIEERRTSPATKTPGRLVSNGYGSRAPVHFGWCVPCRSSEPERINPCPSRATAPSIHSVCGYAPIKTKRKFDGTTSVCPVARLAIVIVSRWAIPPTATTSQCSRSWMVGIDMICSIKYCDMLNSRCSARARRVTLRAKREK